MIESPREAAIAFATMLLCVSFFTGHWWLMLLFAGVLFPWKFFSGIVEEHVLPSLTRWRIKQLDEWMSERERPEPEFGITVARDAEHEIVGAS